MFEGWSDQISSGLR